MILKKSRPLIIAHRGASAFMPENTLEAFDLAFQHYQADMIEFDLRLSKDGVPMVIHDARINRTTNGKGVISKMTCAQIRRWDAGYKFKFRKKREHPYRGKGIHIPTFEELLARYPEKSLAVEIKDRSEELTRIVVRLLDKYHATDKAVVGSKHYLVSRVLKHHYPHIRRFLSEKEVWSLLMQFKRRKKNMAKDPMAVASMPMRFIGIHFDRPAWIHFLHEREIQVFFWAFQNMRQIPALMRNNIDGLVVNDPGIKHWVDGTAPIAD